MPLYEDPIQKCGTRHWLTQPCPKGVCDLLIFENDTAKLVPLMMERAAEDIRETTGVDKPLPSTKPDLETLAELATKRSALSAAEKQKRYRVRQKAKRKGE